MKLKKGKIRRTFQCRNLICPVALSQKTPKKSMGEDTKEPLGRQACQKRTVLEGPLLEGLVSPIIPLVGVVQWLLIRSHYS